MTERSTPAPATDDHAAQLALALGGVSGLAGAAPRLQFRGEGGGFSADRALPGVLAGFDDGVRVHFAMPAGTRADFVLLRLPALPGCYRIDALVVAGSPVAAFAGRVVQVRDRRLPCVDPAAVRIGAADRAPTVELDLRGLLDAAPDGFDLEARIVREMPGDPAAGIDGLANEVLAALRELGDAAFLDTRRQREGLSALGAAAEARTATVASALEGSGQRLTAAIDARTGELAASLAAIDDGLGGRFGALAARLEAAVAGIDSSAAALSGVRADVAEVRADVAHLRLGIEQVFWRRWLRRLRGGAA